MTCQKGGGGESAQVSLKLCESSVQARITAGSAHYGSISLLGLAARAGAHMLQLLSGSSTCLLSSFTKYLAEGTVCSFRSFVDHGLMSQAR